MPATTTPVTIRPLTFVDLVQMAEIYRQAPPPEASSPLLAIHGPAWVAEAGSRLAGFVAYDAVPGLPGVVEIQGYVVPDLRRQGVGSQLLAFLVETLRGTAVTQLSHGVWSLESPAALFLRRHGFAVEHEEWQMQLDDLANLPPATLPPGCDWISYRRPAAVRHFQRLCDDSFRGRPWYQPYEAGEVDARLRDPADILFLAYQGEPAGFAWLHFAPPDRGRIEPLGIAPAYQGRGLGRPLLHGALHQLAERGAASAELGVWRTNQAAIRLYEQAGFRCVARLSYLACDLASRPPAT